MLNKALIDKELKPLLEAWLLQNVQGFRAGAPFRCINPAHQDQHPSMIFNGAGRSSVSPYSVHCFGCGFNGDIFAVFGAVKGLLDFPEQLKAVCAWAGKEPQRYLSRRRAALKAPLTDEEAAAAVESICAEIIEREHGSAFTNLQLMILDAQQDQQGAAEYLADRFYTRPQWTAERFKLGLTGVDGGRIGRGLVKDTYSSLLIPIGHGAALVDPVNNTRLISPCPLFNAHAIAEAAANTRKLFLADAPLDAVAIEDRGQHCAAMLTRKGLKELCRQLKACGWPKNGILILWQQNRAQAEHAKEVLRRCGYKADTLAALAQADETEARRLKAGAHVYFLIKKAIKND